MIITVDGSIGSGKSTLLSKLENVIFCKPHQVVYEPVDEWMQVKVDGDSQSLFEHFYNDMKRYGFMFQMYALKSRFEHMMEVLKSHPDKILICERSHLTDCEIFAKMLRDSNIISNMEYYVYDSYFKHIDAILRPHIKGMIYLRVNPETCMNRIIKRNRKGEESMNIAYLKQLHTQHESWLMNDSNVLVIDGNGTTCDIDAIQKYVQNIVSTVE